MQPERGAVEHELVLAADLIDVDDRQVAFGDARHRDVEAHLVLVALIGRAVRHDQQLGAGLGQALHHLGAPDVLADRQPEAHTAKAHRAGIGPGNEHALLVEHPVVGQIDLETHGRDGAAIEHAIGVVELAVLHPRRPDQHRGTAVGGLARKLFDLGPAGGLQGGLEDQILGRIAAHEQLGKGHQIGAVASRLGTRLARLLGVAGDVADGGIDLGDRDRQAVSGAGVHGLGLERVAQKLKAVLRRCIARLLSCSAHSRAPFGHTAWASISVRMPSSDILVSNPDGSAGTGIAPPRMTRAWWSDGENPC